MYTARAVHLLLFGAPLGQRARWCAGGHLLSGTCWSRTSVSRLLEMLVLLPRLLLAMQVASSPVPPAGSAPPPPPLPIGGSPLTAGSLLVTQPNEAGASGPVLVEINPATGLEVQTLSLLWNGTAVHAIDLAWDADANLLATSAVGAGGVHRQQDHWLSDRTLGRLRPGNRCEVDVSRSAA